MTHKELVEISYRWVLKNCGVGVAFKELKSIDDEIPDVIGFSSWESFLIECKVSRSDFLQDKKKAHRAKGMGNWRFYSCPKGMIRKEELPDKWGLIYVDEKGKAKVEYDCRKKCIKCKPFTIGGRFGIPERIITSRIIQATENRFDADLVAERRIFYTALRRLFIRGYVKHIYDTKYNRAGRTNDFILLNSEHENGEQQRNEVENTTFENSKGKSSS